MAKYVDENFNADPKCLNKIFVRYGLFEERAIMNKIDPDIIYNAMMSGVWWRWVECDCGGKNTVAYFHAEPSEVFFSLLGNNIVIYHEDFHNNYQNFDSFRLYNYGFDWALTVEELKENNPDDIIWSGSQETKGR